MMGCFAKAGLEDSIRLHDTIVKGSRDQELSRAQVSG